jgi:hypothetical protein
MRRAYITFRVHCSQVIDHTVGMSGRCARVCACVCVCVRVLVHEALSLELLVYEALSY